VAPLDRTSALPLWAQLYDDLRRRLAAGEFAEAFPAEMDLVEQYDVSRNTVREAMRRLRDEGVVVSGRGQRPRLADETEIVQPLGALYSLFASVQASGLEQHSEVRVLDTRRDAEVAARLHLDPDSALVHLERLRFAEAEPLALDRLWVPATLGQPLLEGDFSHTGFYDEWLRRAGVTVTGGREQIRAVLPGEEDRRALALPSDAAALAVDRLGYAGDVPVEWRRTLVRGDRFSVMAEFSTHAGYQFDVRRLPAVVGDDRPASTP
jgi:GntR family transcriptional regulator